MSSRPKFYPGIPLLLFLLLAFSSQLSTTFAQGTAFTYQGRLNDGANPANGLYDLTFSLFSAASGAGGIGSPLISSGTAVTNGLFTVTLDFGSQFPGANRWLEIGVRTNGNTGFFTLSPRQALTPAPYAITAGNVVSGGLSGTYGNAVTFNNANNSFSGAFAGNGANVTNVNAASVGGLASSNLWQVGGNNVAAGKFLGSTNNQPVEIWANNQRVMQFAYASNSVDGYSPNVIGGFAGNFVGAGVVGATIVGGGSSANATNRVLGDFSTVVGGSQNTAQGIDSTAMGFGSVAGGTASTAMGDGSTASGSEATAMGILSVASGQASTAMGHSTASGGLSTAMGSSTASGEQSTAMGSSTASGNSSAAMGTSKATNSYATAMGNATAGGQFSTASGASYAGADYSTALGNSGVVGGTNATAMGESFADDDNATAMGQSLAGGNSSTAMGSSSADGDYSTAMGDSGTSGIAATAMGQSTAYGDFATAMGESEADGNFSFAGGYYAFADHVGSFVWADTSVSSSEFHSTAPHQFLIRAAGGVGIGTAAPETPLHIADMHGITLGTSATGGGNTALRIDLSAVQNGYAELQAISQAGISFGNLILQANGGKVGIGKNNPATALDVSGTCSATVFNTTSDRNLKEHFTPVSPREILDKVNAMPISRWNFISEPGAAHLGPMAQDFRAAFGVGTDDKHIATVDEEGVALAAIQGLNQKVDSLRAENADLKRKAARLDELENRLSALEQQLVR